MLSYGMLSASTVMFGLTFLFKDTFRKNYGNGFRASLVMDFGGGLFGLPALLLIKGFVFEFSFYALIVSIISTINGLLFSFCSLKALGKINLSLYSLFSMLGGMALPFVSGIIIHGEPLTLGKLVCFIIIGIALMVTTEKGEKKSGRIYYAGVFIFNGMSGVIANLYQTLPFNRISSAGYSVLKCMVGLVVTAVLLMVVKGEKKKINIKCIYAMAGSGILNRIANWLLLVSLLTLPASAQYPFVTGGTMIVSTVISLFTNKMPSKKEIGAVILAFIGVLLLIMMPEINILTINWR